MDSQPIQDRPRISVVIVTYNFARYLRECIESILAQTLRPFEIIIYDDCSTDDSWRTIAEYRDKYPELFVVHRQQTNVGMHVNVNTALQRARGELVSCLDGDDRWLPRKLELEWEAMRRHPGAKVAYSNIYSINPAGQRTAVWHDGKGAVPPSGDVFIPVFAKRFFPGTRSIFRNPLLYRSALEAMDYHDENVELYIDWDLKIRLAAAYPVAYSGEALVEYRIHPGGIHNQPLGTHLRDLVGIYHKNLPLLMQRSDTEIRQVEEAMGELVKTHGGDPAQLRRISRAAASRSVEPRQIAVPADQDDGENLVFLVSLPRSGSTLLQRVLSNHPDVHSVAEPWLMLHPLYALKRQGFSAEYDAGQARQALDEFLEELPGGEDSYIAAVRSMSAMLYGEVLQSSGKRLFLDKTPRYFYILPELKRTFPRAKFILLMRNPAAVLSSVLRTWFANDPAVLQQSSNYGDMVKGPALLGEGVRVLGDAAITVHYEDLIANPGDTVRRICAHLGIPYRQAMLDYGAADAPRGSFGDPRSVHKHDTVVRDYTDNWREHLADRRLGDFARRYIASLGDSILKDLGYSLENILQLLRGEHCPDAEPRLRQGRSLTSLLKEGEEAFNKGDLVQAETLFNTACAESPRDVEVLNNLVVLHWELRDEERALHFLARALEQNPYNRDTIVNAGQILCAIGQHDDARALCQGYLLKQPEDKTVGALLASLDAGLAEAAGGDEAQQPLVTAIVSTYNSERFLRGCLEDLQAQTIAGRTEIIVVDSGSEQNERAMVEEFQRRYTNIRYIRTEERETIYAAWNRAIAVARGKYLTNANTDDRHHPQAYERLVSVLESRPEVALVYADSKVTREENAEFGTASVEACFRWPDFDARHLFSVCYVGPQPMWRRALHERYGDFDANMRVAGDYEFWLRLATREIFQHVPEELGLYLAASGSIEHAFAATGARETEIARKRNWPESWGERPAPSPGYLAPVEAEGEGPATTSPAGQPVVTIVMPTRDRLHLLGRALDSVIAQNYTQWELIVVNDGGESVRGLVDGRDPHDRIRCIEFGWSRGPAAARNTAFSEARGEIICYLDDDDIYLPDHLQTVVNGLDQGGRDFIYTDAVVVKERLVDGDIQETSRGNPYRHERYSRERLLVNNYIPINTWAHRKTCVEQAGGFDDSLSCYEDWEFLLRLSEKHEFRHIAKTTVEVRQRVDRVDNVSRRKLKDTEQAYETIYARHADALTDDLRAERAAVLKGLNENISAWMAKSGQAPDAGGSSAGPLATSGGYAAWLDAHAVSERDLKHYADRMMSGWKSQPSFHFVMPHQQGQEEALADTLDSLGSQLYGGWGLSVVSNAPCPDPNFARLDMLEWKQVDGDVMPAVNAVVQESGAQWMVLVEAGTLFEPHFLYTCVETLQQQPGLCLLYTDEDRIDTEGRRYDPLFKPDFNLELMRATPYPGDLLLARCEDLQALGGYSTVAGTATSELVFRVAEQAGTGAIGHVADVLVHRQDRFRLAADEQAVADDRRACVAAHLQRSGIGAKVQHGTLFGSYFIDYTCKETPPVDIIVNSNGEAGALELFIGSLRAQTDYRAFRVHLLLREGLILPANLVDSDDVDVHTYAASSDVAPLVRDIAGSTTAEYLLLISQGCVAIQAHWLTRLVAQAEGNDAAVVAPRLISSERKILASGLILGGGSSGVAAGAFDGLAIDESGYMGRSQVAQELSAVPANCMLVKKSVYEQVGGLSPAFRIPLYQSVDFCLQVRAQGGKIVWTPHSTLLYTGDDIAALDGIDLEDAVRRESESLRGQALPVLASDPAYNPNLRLVGEKFAVDTDLVPSWAAQDRSLKRVVGFGSGSLGSWKYRVQQPLHRMHQARTASSLVLPFSATAVRLPTATELERAGPDVLLMHNTLYEGYIDAIEQYKKINDVFTVFGEDDLIFDLPAKNPFSKTVYKDAKKRLRRCLRAADRLVVTTAPLAAALRGMAEDIRVVPNYLDEEIWGGLVSQRAVADKPRVGWAGALQHGGDLEMLTEVVRQTADEVDWVFFGMCPAALRPYVKESHNPIEFARYPEKLASLNLDLAVAPLEHNRFNECKSNLRLLEYGVLGWPVVASDIAPYRDAPVCRVPNQPRAWINAIRERIHDLDAARREGDELRSWVRGNWMLQQHLGEWLAALVPGSEFEQNYRAQNTAIG